MKRAIIGGLLLSTVVWGGYRVVDRSHPVPPTVSIEEIVPVVPASKPWVVETPWTFDAPKPVKQKRARKVKLKAPALKPVASTPPPVVAKKTPDAVLPVSCEKVRWYRDHLSQSVLDSLEVTYKPTAEQKRAALACLKH